MRIFLSYSTQDYEWANRLQLALAQLRPELDIYFAPKGNDLGAYWIERLGSELKTSEALVLVIGQHIGSWQELEYYDALRLNRNSGHPLIAPILLTNSVPGLPFLDQFHQLSLSVHAFDDLAKLIIKALDGIITEDNIPHWKQINPYRGLNAMGTQDAAYFFGRETLSANILSQIEKQPECIQALIGNSGVGKSSLSMAGILAALRSQLWPSDWDQQWPQSLIHSHRWPVCILKPGETPLKSLAQACTALWLESPADIEQEALKWRRLLLDGSSLTVLVDATLQQLAIKANGEVAHCLVLYIDQAEELYSRAEHREAQKFSALLAAAVTKSNLIILMSLRSDYYGFLQQDTALFKASEITDVPPLEKADIEQVIRLPAARLKVQFENPDIVELMAEATAREPGAMPMLSDVLADAWRSMAEQSDMGAVLRFPLSAIDVSHSLAEKVERFMAGHVANEDTLKRLFTLKLAHITQDGTVLRRRVRRSDCSVEEWAVIEALAAPEWRLLTTGIEAGEGTAEVAHETLLRHWPRLTQWLNESREFLTWKGQFESEQLSWEESSEAKRSRALLTGLKLDKAKHWQNTRSSDLNSAEIQFIDDSARAAEKSKQRRLWMQRTILLLMILSVFVAVLAWLQRNSAMDATRQAVINSQRAEQKSKLAIARRLAMTAEKMLDENIGETTLAGLLSVKSLLTIPTIEGKKVLRRVLNLTPANFQRVNSPWRNSQAQLSPDGNKIAFSRLLTYRSEKKPISGLVALSNTHSSSAIIHYDQQGRGTPAISADGKWLSIAGYGRQLRVIDLQINELIIDAHQDDMVDAAFSPDSRYLYVARTDGIIEVRSAPLWRVDKMLSYPFKKDRPNQIKIKVNAKNSQLLLHTPGQNPNIISIKNGEFIELKGHHQHAVAGSIFSASGDSIYTYGWRGGVIVWDAQSGKLVKQYIQNDNYAISSLITSSDGERMIFATKAGDIIIRDTKSGEIQQLSQGSWVNALAISENGQNLAAVSDDGSTVLWDLNLGEKILDIPHDDEVWTVNFGNNEQTLITGSKDGVLRNFSIPNGEELQHLEFDNAITAIAHHPESGILAVGINEAFRKQTWKDVTIIDRQTRKKISKFEHNGDFNRLLFSPDSRVIASTTSASHDIKIWDVITGNLKSKLGVKATKIAFSADSKLLVANSFLEEAVIINIADDKTLSVIGEPGGIKLVNISPDHRTVTTFGQDGSFRSWDLMNGKQLWRRQSDLDDRTLKISPDGSRYADYSKDRKNIIIGEVLTGHVTAKIPAGERGSLLLSQEGHQLLISRLWLGEYDDPGGKYSEVELWDVESSSRLFKLRYEQGRIMSKNLPGKRFAIIASKAVRHDPEGIVDVFSYSGDKIWTAPTLISNAKVIVPTHRKDIVVVADGRVSQIRDITTGNLISDVNESTKVAEVTLDDKLILWRDEGIEIRDIKSGLLVKKIPVSEYIRELAISKDGRFLFAAVNNDYSIGVRIWRIKDWSELRFIKMDGLPLKLIPLIDPDLFGVLDKSNTFRIWRVSTGGEEYRFSHTYTSEGIRIAAKGNRVMTWQGASLRLWEIGSGNELAQRVSQGDIFSPAISPDGRMVAYLTENKRKSKRGGDYKAMEIWEPDAGGAAY